MYRPTLRNVLLNRVLSSVNVKIKGHGVFVAVDGDKAELSTVDGMLVCGQCHGKRPRKLSAKALAMLSSEEAAKDDELETEVENGEVFAKAESPPKLEWSGTSLRKSGRKRKRINLKAGSFAWSDTYDGADDGTDDGGDDGLMKTETGTKPITRLDAEKRR